MDDERHERLVYRLPKPPQADGTTAMVLTSLELLERQSAFIPPPRIHRHRYYGVRAPNAVLRPCGHRAGIPASGSRACGPSSPISANRIDKTHQKVENWR